MTHKRKNLSGVKFHMEVRSEEVDELYPDQAQYEEWDEIEVMVELFCDHPDVEGSFEIIGPRWKIREIMDEMGVDPDEQVSVSTTNGIARVSPIKENSNETITEVMQDISEKSTGKKMSPLQETIVHVFDNLLKL